MLSFVVDAKPTGSQPFRGSVQLAYAKLIVKCLRCHARDAYPMEWVASGMRSLVVAVAAADAELKPRLEELIHAHSDVLFGYRPVISRTVVHDTDEANPGFGGTFPQGGVTGGRIYASVTHSETNAENHLGYDLQPQTMSTNVISTSKTAVKSANTAKSAPIPSTESTEEASEDMDFVPAPVEKPKTTAPPVFKFPVGRSEPQVEVEVEEKPEPAVKHTFVLPEEKDDDGDIELPDINIEESDDDDEDDQEENEDDRAATKLAESGALSQQLVKRLGLSGSKFADMVQGVKDIELMDDPVVVNIAALALKSGNAVILKGGKEAAKSNAILTSIINDALAQSKTISKDVVLLVESRTAIDELLKLDRYIDLVIPRGSNALVRHVQGSTRIPVLGHADGICATYLDKQLDPEMAIRVLIDAKTSAPSACNSTETLLIHESHISTPFFGSLVKKLTEAGIQLRMDEECYDAALKAIPATNSSEPKRRKQSDTSMISKATAQDFDTEFLDTILAVKTVPNVSSAIAHINSHGSHHTDAIISSIKENAESFMRSVDSADTFWNCSTRFADGFRFGFGAEIGVSTNKTHARGPVGLEGMLIYKFRLYGNGQCTQDYGAGKKSFVHAKLEVDEAKFQI
ncbi:hypothetical protein HDU81_007095 [Chytriomyces hyalinus]|nr:hypothetical protein HDU81_007095 [Chytriomyces hyalinus]